MGGGRWREGEWERSGRVGWKGEWEGSERGRGVEGGRWMEGGIHRLSLS